MAPPPVSQPGGQGGDPPCDALPSSPAPPGPGRRSRSRRRRPVPPPSVRGLVLHRLRVTHPPYHDRTTAGGPRPFLRPTPGRLSLLPGRRSLHAAHAGSEVACHAESVDRPCDAPADPLRASRRLWRLLWGVSAGAKPRRLRVLPTSPSPTLSSWPHSASRGPIGMPSTFTAERVRELCSSPTRGVGLPSLYPDPQRGGTTLSSGPGVQSGVADCARSNRGAPEG